jgi:hypothetical protein
MPRKRISNRWLTAAAVAWAAVGSSGCGGDGVANLPSADASPNMTTVTTLPGDGGSPTDDAASGDDATLAAADAGATDTVVGDASDEASRAPPNAPAMAPPAASAPPASAPSAPPASSPSAPPAGASPASPPLASAPPPSPPPIHGAGTAPPMPNAPTVSSPPSGGSSAGASPNPPPAMVRTECADAATGGGANAPAPVPTAAAPSAAPPATPPPAAPPATPPPAAPPATAPPDDQEHANDKCSSPKDGDADCDDAGAPSHDGPPYSLGHGWTSIFSGW